MKTIIALALALLLLPSGFALTIDTDKENYAKGQSILIFGACEQAVELFITAKEKQVDFQNAACIAGSYTIQILASMAYPGGALTLAANDGSGPNAQTAITLLSSRESGFLTVTFLSPVKNEIQRGQPVELTVRVFNAEQASENAAVQTWLPNGQKIVLQKTESATYSATVALPVDTPLGPWNLVVTAEQTDQNQTVGGEQNKTVLITAAPIQIELVSPQNPNIGTLEKTRLIVKTVYANGEPLTGPVVTARLNNQTIGLAPQSATEFFAELEFNAAQTGRQTLEITVRDQGQNTQTKTIELFVTQPISSSLIANLPLIIVILALLVGVWFFAIPKVQAKKNESRLRNRKTELETQIKNLQTDYFEKASITKEKFAVQNAQLQNELADTTKKLNKQNP